MHDLAERIHTINSRIAAAAHRAGRNPADIQLIAVTKNVPVETIREAISLGVRHIGESKVQEALLKKEQLGARSWELEAKTKPLAPSPQLLAGRGERPFAPTWHLIGHLQTNKVRDAVQIFDWIHSVDSLRLAEKINQECEKIQKIMPVLIEVNVSGEPSKFGVSPEELPNLIESCQPLKSIRVCGLMTMAPVVSDPNQTRPYFQRLTHLRNQLHLYTSAPRHPYTSTPLHPDTPAPSTPLHLSMGMSQDFEVAIEEGATMVRIGAAIFEI